MEITDKWDENGNRLLAKLQECWSFQCCFQIRVVFLEGATSIIAYQVHQFLKFKRLSKSIAFICSLKYGNPFELVGIPAVSVHACSKGSLQAGSCRSNSGAD